MRFAALACVELPGHGQRCPHKIPPAQREKMRHGGAGRGGGREPAYTPKRRTGTAKPACRRDRGATYSHLGPPLVSSSVLASLFSAAPSFGMFSWGLVSTSASLFLLFSLSPLVSSALSLPM